MRDEYTEQTITTMSRGFNSRYLAADATQSVRKAAQIPAACAWVVSGRIRPFDWVFPQLGVFGRECSLFGFAGCDSDLRQRSQSQADRASEGHHVNRHSSIGGHRQRHRRSRRQPGPESSAEQQFSDVLSRELEVDHMIQMSPDAPVMEDDRPVNEYYYMRHHSTIFGWALSGSLQ